MTTCAAPKRLDGARPANGSRGNPRVEHTSGELSVEVGPAGGAVEVAEPAAGPREPRPAVPESAVARDALKVQSVHESKRRAPPAPLDPLAVDDPDHVREIPSQEIDPEGGQEESPAELAADLD